MKKMKKKKKRKSSGDFVVSLVVVAEQNVWTKTKSQPRKRRKFEVSEKLVQRKKKKKNTNTRRDAYTRGLFSVTRSEKTRRYIMCRSRIAMIFRLSRVSRKEIIIHRVLILKGRGQRKRKDKFTHSSLIRLSLSKVTTERLQAVHKV